MSIERKTNDFDVVIAGGGLAGIATARGLRESGTRVAIVEPSQPREKSLLINLDQLPPDLLRQLDKTGAVTRYSNYQLINKDHPERSWTCQNHQEHIHTEGVAYMPMVNYLKEGLRGTEIIDCEVVQSVESDDCVIITLSDNRKIKCSFLVDASGDASPVSRHHSIKTGERLLNDDPVVLSILGWRVFGKFPVESYCDPIGREIGYGWIMPFTKDYGDVATSDYFRLSRLKEGIPSLKNKLQHLIDFARREHLCEINTFEQPLEGFIRVEPIKKAVADMTKRVYILGGAAGMTSPYEAELAWIAVKWGDKLAELISSDKSPLDYLTEWRYRHPPVSYDLELALLRKRLLHERQGDFGSSALIYKSLIAFLPPELQRDLLTKRKFPWIYFPYLAKAIVKHPELIPNLLELIPHYLNREQIPVPEEK